MSWIAFFQSLGFFGFQIVWALIIGFIAIFALNGISKGKGIIKDIIGAWVLGLFLVNSSAIGALVAAVFIRLFLTGLIVMFKSLKFDDFKEIKFEEGMVKEKKVKKIKNVAKIPKEIKKGISILMVTIAILLVLGVGAALFIPPTLMDVYRVDDITMEKVTASSGISVDDITWNDIKHDRLVSQEYALQIPKTMVTETGWQLSDDWDGVYPVPNKDGIDTLSWIMVYEPDKLINIGEPSPAYIRVNAEDPADREKIMEELPYSEERGGIIEIIYQILTGKIRDVKFLMWLKYPFYEYGDTIFTHDADDNPVWIAPVKMSMPTSFITTFYTDQVGMATFDSNGEIVVYTREEIAAGNAPEWLTEQILIDEDYTEMRIHTWAKYNSWENFIQYTFEHEQVFEIAQDLFFQYDFDSKRNFALLQLEPEGRERKAITQYIEVESSTDNYGEIKVFDVRELGLIGPVRALDDVKGQISLYSDWRAQQPIFKEIRGRYFYVIPVYSGFGEGMVLRAVAVVDAKTEQVKLFRWADITGEGNEVPLPGETTTTAVTTTIDVADGCTVVSTEPFGDKTRIIIEC
ncbi:hypothetical protein CL614_05020 [archaeon]|nr:hypothetical protein [archaeon]|tara:strand:- start:2096 stop:3820 length:1725 start_codon:yes stop_codon:yes gene_type:complete